MTKNDTPLRAVPERLVRGGHVAGRSPQIYAGDALVASVDGFPLNARQPNARRLVAAWNACAGIDTETLEGGAVGRLVRAARTLGAVCELAEAARSLRDDVTGVYQAGRISAEPFVRLGNALAPFTREWLDEFRQSLGHPFDAAEGGETGGAR